MIKLECLRETIWDCVEGTGNQPEKLWDNVIFSIDGRSWWKARRNIGYHVRNSVWVCIGDSAINDIERLNYD